MINYIKYGRYMRLGKWAEDVFQDLRKNIPPLVSVYIDSGIAQDAAAGRSSAEDNVHTFLEALATWYLLQVLLEDWSRSKEDDVRKRIWTILKAASIEERSDTVGLSDIINRLFHRQLGAGIGLSFERNIVDILSEQLNFSLTSEGDRESFERRNRDFFTHYSERIVIPYLYTLFARDQDLVRRVIDKNNKSLW